MFVRLWFRLAGMEVQQVSEVLTLLVGRCVELVEDLSRRWLLNRSLEGAELHQFYLLSELLPSLVPLSHVKADDAGGVGVRGSQPGFAQATANCRVSRLIAQWR